jgi:hypothetical protein
MSNQAALLAALNALGIRRQELVNAKEQNCFLRHSNCIEQVNWKETADLAP